MQVDRKAIEGAWRGRVSGCQLGKPVELLSMQQGFAALQDHLREAGAVPLRDYLPDVEFDGADPDDDINYSVLALLMLEEHGAALSTEDVARSWLALLPFSQVFTAEREAYKVLVNEAHPFFAIGAVPGFDLGLCADNVFNEWIGAQIRADVYGWVCPGNPAEAARLAGVDAALSHRDAGIHGAQFVAACGAAIPVADSFANAVARASGELPADSDARRAVDFGVSVVGRDDAVEALHKEYGHLSPVHTLNNLALVVWALLEHETDFSAAVGEAVAAGWDTDCNGATVGGLWGISGEPIPSSWTAPWNDRVGLTLAGYDEISIAELVDRTIAVAARL